MEYQALLKTSRLILVFFLVSMVFLVSPEWLMLLFLLLFIDSLFSRKQIKKLIVKLTPAIFIAVLILIVNIFAVNLYFGLYLAMRFVIVYWLAQILAEELPKERFIGGIVRWKVFNLSFARMGLILLIAIISFPIIFNESKTIYQAHISRGIDFKEGNVAERIKHLLYFLNAFFLKIFERIEALSFAIESRIPHLA